MSLFSSSLGILGASTSRVCLTSVRSDSLDLVDYSGLSGMNWNAGGGYSDISAYDVDYFEPSTGKRNHLRPEDMELAGLEGTIVPSATTIGNCLIPATHVPITLFY